MSITGLLLPLTGKRDLVALGIRAHGKMRGLFRGVLRLAEYEPTGVLQHITGREYLTKPKLTGHRIDGKTLFKKSGKHTFS